MTVCDCALYFWAAIILVSLVFGAACVVAMHYDDAFDIFPYDKGLLD